MLFFLCLLPFNMFMTDLNKIVESREKRSDSCYEREITPSSFSLSFTLSQTARKHVLHLQSYDECSHKHRYILTHKHTRLQEAVMLRLTSNSGLPLSPCDLRLCPTTSHDRRNSWHPCCAHPTPRPLLITLSPLYRP